MFDGTLREPVKHRDFLLVPILRALLKADNTIFLPTLDWVTKQVPNSLYGLHDQATAHCLRTTLHVLWVVPQ